MEIAARLPGPWSAQLLDLDHVADRGHYIDQLWDDAEAHSYLTAYSSLQGVVLHGPDEQRLLILGHLTAPVPFIASALIPPDANPDRVGEMAMYSGMPLRASPERAAADLAIQLLPRYQDALSEWYRLHRPHQPRLQDYLASRTYMPTPATPHPRPSLERLTAALSTLTRPAEVAENIEDAVVAATPGSLDAAQEYIKALALWCGQLDSEPGRHRGTRLDSAAKQLDFILDELQDVAEFLADLDGVNRTAKARLTEQTQRHEAARTRSVVPSEPHTHSEDRPVHPPAWPEPDGPHRRH